MVSAEIASSSVSGQTGTHLGVNITIFGSYPSERMERSQSWRSSSWIPSEGRLGQIAAVSSAACANPRSRDPWNHPPALPSPGMRTRPRCAERRETCRAMRGPVLLEANRRALNRGSAKHCWFLESSSVGESHPRSQASAHRAHKRRLLRECNQDPERTFGPPGSFLVATSLSYA